MGVSAIDELTGNAIFNGVTVQVTPISTRETAEEIHQDESVEEFSA
jgi:hypothetical protein